MSYGNQKYFVLPCSLVMISSCPTIIQESAIVFHFYTLTRDHIVTCVDHAWFLLIQWIIMQSFCLFSSGLKTHKLYSRCLLFKSLWKWNTCFIVDKYISWITRYYGVRYLYSSSFLSLLSVSLSSSLYSPSRESGIHIKIYSYLIIREWVEQIPIPTLILQHTLYDSIFVGSIQ